MHVLLSIWNRNISVGRSGTWAVLVQCLLLPAYCDIESLLQRQTMRIAYILPALPDRARLCEFPVKRDIEGMDFVSLS